MSAEEKIDIDLFKVVFRAIAQSDNLEIMANHLTQLLVAALEIKGCTIFALNVEVDELEVLAPLKENPSLSGMSAIPISFNTPRMPPKKVSGRLFPFPSIFRARLSVP